MNVLNALFFIDGNSGIAVGDRGTILSTYDGGATWEAQESGTAQNLNAVFFVDSSTGMAVGSDGAALRTTDGGITWSQPFIADDYSLNFFGVALPDLQRGNCCGPRHDSPGAERCRGVGHNGWWHHLVGTIQWPAF